MKVRWLVLAVLVAVLLVPAVLISVARALQPSSGAWVRLVAFTPFATLLYGAAALLLLIGWLRARGVWRGLSRTLLVASVLAALVHAAWASGPYLGTPAVAATRGTTLQVMTSNLRLGEADTAEVVETALHEHVDLLVLEEVTPSALADLESAGLSSAYPHHAGRSAAGPAGTMVFATSRLTGVHRVATGFGSWSMTVRAPGGAFHLVAVHPRPPKGSAMQWREDQGVIRNAARSLTGPTLLVGDFNATTDHQPMQELHGRGYRDAATQARSRWQPTWPSAGVVSWLGFPVPSLLPIDHVLTRGGPSAVRTRTVTIDDTDHRALIATVVL
jgi:endonuclease/exonuclease/phosphatase (EEP) superfamily protein YafD